MTTRELPETAVEMLRSTGRIAVFSGAGLSKACGIPS
jgi:NAD-dependent SIR2 family protein deacetylase